MRAEAQRAWFGFPLERVRPWAHRRSWFPQHAFLSRHLPDALPSIGFHRLHRYYDVSVSCQLPVKGAAADRYPQSTTRTFPMSRRQPPGGPTARLFGQPFRMQYRSPHSNQASHVQIRTRSLAHRTTWPSHVRPPTGHQFSSPCSPRDLAAPQLGSDTRPECLCLGGDLHPTDACADGRTTARRWRAL